MAAEVIALIDGEHHPAVVHDALAWLHSTRGVAGVVFCGGEEKVAAAVLEEPEAHYGFAFDAREDPARALRRVAAETSARTVVDLADEPVLSPQAKLRLASLALHLGLGFESPGMRLDAPGYERLEFDGSVLAVIGSGKRTGKTAVASYWARLLRENGSSPVVVAMGRGGPATPQVASADTSLEDLLAIADAGGHAASDYLEDAVLAGVPAVGSRRVGGGLAGQAWDTNVLEAARRAASLEVDTILLEGSGACVPPIEADRTVCIAGGEQALTELGSYRLMRAQLALVMAGGEDVFAQVAEICPGRTLRCALTMEPAEPLPSGSRAAVFTTGAPPPEGLEAAVESQNLARRSALERDLDAAARESCDVYLTELKAAAVDTVARRAAREGARVVFLRGRPVADGADLDAILLELHADSRG